MTSDDDRDLKDQIVVLKQEHRSLDDAIVSLSSGFQSNQIQMQRMKKQKLQLRDQISRLEDELYPDIIA